MKKIKTKNTLITILVAVLCILFLFPFIMMLITSLKTLPEIMTSAFVWVPEELQFSNYIEAMRTGSWGRYFFNSFFITVVTVFVSIIFNSLAGFGFARINFRGRNTLFFFALIGMMVPAQVTMISVFINLKNVPLFGGNDIFGVGGSGLIDTYLGLVLPYIAGSFGVFLCRQFYMNFPKSLDDAAKIDGCSRIGAYIRIYLPLSKPILATLAVLKASQTWNDYLWPLIMTNGDDMKTVQPAIASQFVGETLVQWHLLMAATALVMLPLIILFIFTQKYFVESIVATGIKG